MSTSNLLNFLLPHWPFLFATFTLGMVGSVFKARVWTKERAARNSLFRWMRATLPLHPVVTGCALGAIGASIGLGASPGVESPGDLALYYASAGAFSAWAYGAVKYFLRSRGVRVRYPDLPSGHSRR